MNRIILFNADTPLSKEWALFRRGNITAIALFIKSGSSYILKGYDALTGTAIPSGSYPVGEANYYETSVNLSNFINQESRQVDYDELASFLILGRAYCTGIDRLNHCFGDITLGALHLTIKAGTPCITPAAMTKLEFQGSAPSFEPAKLHKAAFLVQSTAASKAPQSASVECLRRALERLSLPVLRLYRIDRCYNQIAQEVGNEPLPMLLTKHDEIVSRIDSVHPELANALDQQLNLFKHGFIE